MRSSYVAITLLALLLPSASLAASGVERWTAISTTAMAITGDIELSPNRLVAAGNVFPLAVAADVTNFASDHGPQAARILRVVKPSNPVLKNGNTLCGTSGDPTVVRWIAVYRAEHGKSLTLAAFSGYKQPNGESDASLCGTFLYSR